jgi:flagellar protein FliS
MNEAYRNSAFGNSNLTSYLEHKALSASPLELVAMIYSKAISELREARRHLADRSIALRSQAISKACDAIGELDGSLNMEAGGELALRLRGLYRYCITRLLDANLQQADEPLAETLGLMTTLSEGWQNLAQGRQTPEPPMQKTPTGGWGHEGVADTSGQSHSWTL